MADSDTAASAVHLPMYMTPPGETDVLFVVVVIFVVLLVLGLGVFYFKLHALPEQMAHNAGRTHMQFVAILALLALFTHNNLFWIAALLLAAIEFPEYERYFSSISTSLQKIADRGDTAPAAASEPDGAGAFEAETTPDSDAAREV